MNKDDYRLGPKVSPPVPEPSEIPPERVRPGIFRGGDGRLFTMIEGNEPHFKAPVKEEL